MTEQCSTWCINYHAIGTPRDQDITVVVTTKDTSHGAKEIVQNFEDIGAAVIWLQPLLEYDAAIKKGGIQ